MQLAAILLLFASCALSRGAHSSQPPFITRSAQPAEIFSDNKGIEYRLPNNTRPLAYDIHLTTDVHTQTNFTFTGTVAITFEALDAPSSSITLHQKQLTIMYAQLIDTAAPTTTIPLSEPVYVEANEFLSYQLAETFGNQLLPGETYVLNITYRGELRDDKAGFYRTSYLDDAGQRRWLATTQFEPMDARHGFPCFDEPALRAKFSIRITHGRQYHAISNMPVMGEPVINGDLATTQFAETPSMPTYLVAFIVSDFANLTATDPKGLEQRVFARPNAIDTGAFALGIGIKSLDAYDQYFGIPYALPKMDQAAVPYFAAGAMENWGLVTYREVCLLFNESLSTYLDRITVVTDIMHEYSHQWFGNLVTPKWWTYTWLNEGFATLFENYATDWQFPQWRMMDAFVVNSLQLAMDADSTNGSRPMTYYVDNPVKVPLLFDSITYHKSASVLRMFFYAFTQPTFKKAMIGYLKQKADSDADEDDLFAAIETAVRADGTLDASLNVATIMSTWTQQPGYPLVVAIRDYASDTVSLRQERYYSDPLSPDSEATWWIPYNFATAAAEASQFETTVATNWMNTPESPDVSIPGLRADEWLLLNKQQTGYYRVQYDVQNYKLLVDALRADHSAIYVTNRAQLIDDAFELARSGRQSYTIALDLITYLTGEVEFVPWASALKRLAVVDRLQSNSAKFERYELFIQRLLKILFDTMTLQAPAHEEHIYRKQVRSMAIEWSCRYGSSSCREETGAAFRGYLAGSQTLNPDIRAAVLCSGVRSATAEQFEQVQHLLQQETDSELRYELINALACCSQPELLKSYVQSTIGDAEKWQSPDERYRAFAQVLRNHAGTQLAIEFLATYLVEAKRDYGKANLIEAFARVAEQVNSAELEIKFKEMLIAARFLPDSVTEATLKRSEQIVAGNVAWIAANQRVIEEWIDENGVSSVMVSSVLLVVLAIGMQFN